MAQTVLQFRSAAANESEICYRCGVEFWSPVIAKRHADREWFYCPNGHPQRYIETTAQKLQKQLDAEKRKREQAERDAEWARAQERGARVAEGKAKAALKRTVTRVNAGVCPHCHRTFQQLARHMQCKHANERTTENGTQSD